jgi:hypothetical protein
MRVRSTDGCCRRLAVTDAPESSNSELSRRDSTGLNCCPSVPLVALRCPLQNPVSCEVAYIHSSQG